MAASAGNVDPITFEILSHRLHQIAKEMGSTLERVGGTVNTTQQHDYMASIYRANGEILATGESMGWHVACAGFAVKRILERFEDDGGIGRGDIFLINDPYLTAIHQSDVYMVSPIHFEQELVGWSATFVHVMDIGAMSPGGDSPGATEIFHEGIRIPGVKLVEGGKFRKDVFDMILNMTRQPVMVGLDLKCELAANNVAKMRMEGMYGQYGPELVDGVSQEMIRYSETVLRRRLREIPDGVWREEAEIGMEEKWKVALTLRKEGERLIFDFTGTDKQAKTGINLPYHATFGACFEVVLATLGYDIPKNHGVMRPLEVIAPEGTVVNVKPPAPVSLNTTSGGQTTKYVVKSVLGQMLAASEKWRHEVMAHNVGQRIARHAGVNQHGRYYASSFALGAFAGSGARARRDGIDSGHAQLTCPNVEWVELNFPLLHLFRRHITDGGGAGKYRGGVGGETAVVVHDAPEEKITVIAYGVTGLRNSGVGIFGGYPGAPSIIAVVEGASVDGLLDRGDWPADLEKLDGRVRLMPYADFALKRDEVLYMRQANGGGCADPLDRDPEWVRRDVINGVVSAEVARKIYGVVIDEHTNLDSAGTANFRKTLRANRLKGDTCATIGQESQIGQSYPPYETFEVFCGVDGEVIRCRACQFVLCGLDEDWRQACRAIYMSPVDAGSPMKVLMGQYVLQQLCCPSCGRMLDNGIVKDPNTEEKPRKQRRRSRK